LTQHGGIPGRTVAEATAKDYGYTLPNYEVSLRTSTVTSNESDKKLEERLAKRKIQYNLCQFCILISVYNV
jgi:hypothetical protein